MHRIPNTHPLTAETMLDHLITAVHEAREEIASQKHYHIIMQGQLQGICAGSFYYTFILKDEWEPGADTVVHIEIDAYDAEQTITGTIVSTTNCQMTLVTNVPLPHPVLLKARLYEVNARWLQTLEEALIDLKQQENLSASMGAKAFGLALSYVGKGQRRASVPSVQPDRDQEQVIVLGMESERLVVAGPPRSGKTSIACALAMEYLMAGKTVLLVAAKHGTLERMMERLLCYSEQSKNTMFIQNHQIISLGPSTLCRKDVSSPHALHLLVDRELGSLARKRNRLRQKLSERESKCASLARDLIRRQQRWQHQQPKLLAQLQAALQEREIREARERERHTRMMTRLTEIAQELEAHRQEKGAREQEVQAHEAGLPALIQVQTICEQVLQQATDALTAWYSSSTMDRLVVRLLGTTEQELLAEVKRCQSALSEATLAVKREEHQRDAAYWKAFEADTAIIILEKEKRQLGRKQQEITEDAACIEQLTIQIGEYQQALKDGIAGISATEAQLADEQQRCHALMMQLQAIEEKQQLIASHIIAGARLIGTTMPEMMNCPYLHDRTFDAVIMDDVGMISLPAIFIAAAHATRHLVLIGDPIQHGPQITLKKKKAPEAAYWLTTNVFSHLRLTDKSSVSPHIWLSHCYRMHPEITAPLSQFIYQQPFTSSLPPHRSSFRLEPCPAWPLMLIDTGDVDRDTSSHDQPRCLAKQLPDRSSRYNLYHVECVVQLVHLLCSQLHSDRKPQIGIITPYEAQKMKLCQALHQHGLLHLIHVGTEHSFHDGEYPCVIFDTTEGYGVPISQRISNTWGHHGIPHEATRLLAMAHARACDKLIYLANIEYIRQEAYRRGHVLTQMINDIDAQAHLDSSALFRDKSEIISDLPDTIQAE